MTDDEKHARTIQGALALQDQVKARIGGFKPIGLAARQAEAAKEQATKREAAGLMQPLKLVTPAEAIDRIGIVFDDSGSMRGETIENAKAGVEEFLRSCKPNQTAVAVYPMNASALVLSTDLPALSLLVQGIRATGCTPLLETLDKFVLTGPLAITRAIVFSDGTPDVGLLTKEKAPWNSPPDDENHPYTKLIAKHKESKVPVDTVFIGPEHAEHAIKFMKTLAEDTGGIFLHFDPAKSNFRTAFKYLSPGSRYMLADKSFVEKLERGAI